MIYIDSALLNVTERVCRRFQLLTGRTNVWLAFQLTNLSIVMYFVWAGVYLWSSEGIVRVAVALFCGGVLYLLTQTIFKVPVDLHESNAYRRVEKGLRNPRRVRDAPLRIAFLTLSIMLFFPLFGLYLNLQLHIAVPVRLHIAVLGYSLIVLTTVVLYMLACDPLPPCAGRVREWLRALIPARMAASGSTSGD